MSVRGSGSSSSSSSSNTVVESEPTNTNNIITNDPNGYFGDRYTGYYAGFSGRGQETPIEEVTYDNFVGTNYDNSDLFIYNNNSRASN